MFEWVAQSLPDIEAPQSLITLLYFAGASLITVFIETLRRWVKHRMDIWEAQHPLPEKDTDDDD